MIHDIQEMCEQHFNEPIIIGFDVVRLIGYGETDQDCYLICSTRKGIIWHTGVGGYIFLDRLKGQGYIKSNSGEEWDDFVRIDKDLELNGMPKVDKFIVDIQT